MKIDSDISLTGSLVAPVAQVCGGSGISEISGASGAFAFVRIGKLPCPVFAPEDGTGSGMIPGGEAGHHVSDAANPAGEGGEAGGDIPDSLIGGDGQDPAGGAEAEAGARTNADADADVGAGADPLDAVPEDGVYDFSSLDLPQGMEIDQELAEMAGPRLAEANLSQRQANSVAEIFTDMRKQQIEDWHKVNSDWQQAVRTDKEIGGDNLKTAISHAEKFINHFGNDALRDYLTSSGGGNNPEIIRAFSRAGRMLAEDEPSGRASGGGGKDTAAILYPND